ncbi:MAG: mitochondrial fission ELM1 family protein [Alphaproteobacteria bacterium]|nr:mitochondrial fission ELM1 family protein [Alphaproteobacteria bacterium]MDE2336546.1 mitochondrial fission ELM1 family protein [Alphaproteobacteria bacterium]
MIRTLYGVIYLTESIKTCWIITGGDTGTENQCIGLAEALGLAADVKRLKLKTPWRQLSPWFRLGFGHALARGSASLDPPYPDLLIASGRKSIAAALHVKKRSGGKTFLVQVQDPRYSPRSFDLIVAPQHDPARGPNVILTTGATHRVTGEKIKAEMEKFKGVLERLPHPRVAVLIGGLSKGHRMTRAVTEKLAAQLLALVKEKKASLMITASRRTGEENAAFLRETLRSENIYFWDGKGGNPYFALLGYADHIIVTEDSVSMVSEALSTGKPVHVAALKHAPGGAARHDLFHKMLRDQGYTRPFAGTLETWPYAPLRDTMNVANEIRKKLRMKG